VSGAGTTETSFRVVSQKLPNGCSWQGLTGFGGAFTAVGRLFAVCAPAVPIIVRGALRLTGRQASVYVRLMQAMVYARLMAGIGGGHRFGLRHGNLFGLHILGTLLMVAATVVLAAVATAGVAEWADRKYGKEDTTKAAAWITFLVVFAALGWLTLHFVR